MEEDKNDFNLGDLNLDFFQEVEDFNMFADFETESRFIKPPLRLLRANMVFYNYAKELAKEVSLEKRMRFYSIISGAFIFGDFIEALLVEKQVFAKKMTINTLSMSQNNIESLQNLLKNGYIGELNLIVSDYFFSHERGFLIPYIYECLDIDNKFQLAVCSTHCKTCIFETEDRKYFTIHGSANLRSSENIEQFMMEEGRELYKFNDNYQSKIIDTYKTINKSIRGQKLWQVVAKNGNM